MPVISPRTTVVLALCLACCMDYGIEPERTWVHPVADDPGAGAQADNDEDCSDDPDLGRRRAAVDESCEHEIDIEVEWNEPMVYGGYNTPTIGQLTDDNGDGLVDDSDVPDIVAPGALGLYAFSGDGSGMHWADEPHGARATSPAQGDLDGDGLPEVIGITVTSVYAMDGRTGEHLWSSGPVIPTAEHLGGGVAIADLDGDGGAEVVAGNIIFSGADGSMLGAGVHGTGTNWIHGPIYASLGVPADIDLDGRQEVVVGNALYGVDGSTRWFSGEADGYVAVGDFDDDDYGEIAVSVQGCVRLQDDDGTPLWTTCTLNDNVGPPAIADLNGDGMAEIVVLGSNTLAVIEHDGEFLWELSHLQSWAGGHSVAIFDFEADGAREIVFSGYQAMLVVNGATGHVKLKDEHHQSYGTIGGPAIADVDKDGSAEIVLLSHGTAAGWLGLTVFGSPDSAWAPAGTSWNEHAYRVSNVDGTSIPASPEPPWLAHNTFRAAPLDDYNLGWGSDAVGMLGAICDCDDGVFQAVLRVGNSGTAPLPAGLPVRVYSGDGEGWTLLETRETHEPVPPGQTTEGLLFRIAEEDVPEGTLRFVLDEDGTLDECHEDNNTVEIDGVCA